MVRFRPLKIGRMRHTERTRTCARTRAHTALLIELDPMTARVSFKCHLTAVAAPGTGAAATAVSCNFKIGAGAGTDAVFFCCSSSWCPSMRLALLAATCCAAAAVCSHEMTVAAQRATLPPRPLLGCGGYLHAVFLFYVLVVLFARRVAHIPTSLLNFGVAWTIWFASSANHQLLAGRECRNVLGRTGEGDICTYVRKKFSLVSDEYSGIW